MYTVLTTLVSAGWTVKSTGDGTTYTASGNGLTSGGTGAGGLGNTNAWFRIQAPAVSSQTREFCFQKTTAANTTWRITYSPSVGFTSGSPSATRVPTATDSVTIFGSGTDASPTGAQQFGADGNYRFSIVAGDSTVGYSFYWFGSNSTTTTVSSGFLLDVLKSGTYSVGDVDPCVIYDGYGTNIFADGSSTNNGIAGYNNTKGLLGTSYVGISTSFIVLASATATANIIFPAKMGSNSLPNPFTSADDMFPVYWGRLATQTPPLGYKGTSSIMLAASTSRTSLDTFTISTAKDHIFLGWYVFPWDSSTPTV